MDGGFYVLFLTVFQSYQADGRVIMKGCVKWNPIYSWKGFYLQLNISVISSRWESDNERLCAMEPHIQLEKILPPAEFKPETNGSAG